MSCPRPSAYRQQALVLRDVRLFELAALRHTGFVRVTDLTGRVTLEEAPRFDQPDARPAIATEAAALAKLAAARARTKKDCLPCRVTDGLYIGGAGAARNLKALRKRGITHIVNASPSVPCHFKDNPEGCFDYLALQLFDDADADLLPHIEAANAFIAAARARGGAVLVHCYAGQSRSAALVIAYLISSSGLSLMEAWTLTRRARLCAQPNSGFLRQLALYSKGLARGPADSDEEEVEAAVASGQLVLTQ